jgi:hypothetical protein
VSPEIAPCTSEDGRERLAGAEAYIEAAATVAASDDVVVAARRFKSNTIINNYVHAGIAASDAICCFELKARSRGDDHRQVSLSSRR